MTRKEKKVQSIVRSRVLASILLIPITVYTVRMFSIQIINDDHYTAQANGVSEYNINVKAARGEILDRYGRPIAINRQGFDIMLNAAFLPEGDTNETILLLTKLLTNNKETWIDELPINATGDQFIDPEKNANEISKMKSLINVADYATATDCYNTMVTKFGIDHYNAADTRTIMGVRYTMMLHDFSYSTPYVFAQDVSSVTTTVIKERQNSFPGVDVSAVPYREYVDPSFATHIIGTTGPIYAEEWAELKVNGYSLDDQIGKSGLEHEQEDDLRGTNGVDKVKVDAAGNKTYEHESLPINGNTVVLTLDRDLQKVAQDTLANTINELSEKFPACRAGAVVVTMVDTGEILAAATYPSYTSVEYEKGYDKLLANTDKPLFNRALDGAYPPGSTYKPMVASAALQSGTITRDTKITCTGSYVVPALYGEDMVFTCTDVHGSLNVENAIGESCNVFFYKVGQDMGIETMDNYAMQFGFGLPPGDELHSAEGLLASPQAKEDAGQTWNAGDEVQAAIGQSDNAFTPLQLAMYTAAIATDGTRYVPHWVKSVKSYSLDREIRSTSSKVAKQVAVSKENFDLVQIGMRLSATTGTASPYFASYKISAATKTGTAETMTAGGDNAILVSYAPYDDPEIAVAVVLEHGDYGANASPIVLDIYNQYFFSNQNASSSGSNGVLLP